MLLLYYWASYNVGMMSIQNFSEGIHLQKGTSELAVRVEPHDALAVHVCQAFLQAQVVEPVLEALVVDGTRLRESRQLAGNAPYQLYPHVHPDLLMVPFSLQGTDR